jgi:lipopolysaccharide transport system ATP-binding protein
MSDAIIVENLSKQFKIGQLQGATMLREAIVNMVKSPFRKSHSSQETLWALNDVSFTVKEGEVLGILGRNGAGKSTLLKILSKVTRPTSGSIRVNGRVAALLEVGTGFHEELTGRENVYMCGSILGMRKKRIDAKMEAIIAFAGVEKFIDTPIKRYSSGMRLRLGFSVAANLESDILFIDEVLAVGDGEFQKKCLEAMGELQGSRRTVLFVSHNLAAIEHLCTRAIWVDGGRIRQDGRPREVIEAYMSTFAENHQQGLDLSAITARRGSGDIRFTKIEYLDSNKKVSGLIRSGDQLTIRLHYETKKPQETPIFGIEIHTQMGTLVSHIHTYNSGFDIPYVPVGIGQIDVVIQELNLMHGRYYLSLFLANLGYMFHDVLQHCAVLEIEPSNRYGLNRGIQGSPIVSFSCKWESALVESAYRPDEQPKERER